MHACTAIPSIKQYNSSVAKDPNTPLPKPNPFHIDKASPIYLFWCCWGENTTGHLDDVRYCTKKYPAVHIRTIVTFVRTIDPHRHTLNDVFKNGKGPSKRLEERLCKRPNKTRLRFPNRKVS